MEGRRAHIAANMEGMSVMVVDGNRPEDGGFWNPPLHTLLHPLNQDLLTQTTCARPNPHFSLHTHSVIVRGWWPVREWGVLWKRSTGNISSELKIQDIQNHTCTEYKPHGSVHPLLCCNSYCTKRWSIFGVFFKGHGVCCNILHLSREQYVINPCFDPDDLYKAQTGAQAQKKYSTDSHLLRKQRKPREICLESSNVEREREPFPVKRGIWLPLTSSYPPAIQDLPPQQRLLNFKCHGE